jgi:beta-aspartyl-peptidase (threonine type)
MSKLRKKKKVVLAVHGGAGVILRSQLTPEMESRYRLALQDAMIAGYTTLRKKQDNDEGSNMSSSSSCTSAAAAAAEAAVRCLEDCPLFNAGMGSVIGNDGKIRMDAAIMTCSSDANMNGKGMDEAGSYQTTLQDRQYPITPKPSAGSVAGVEGIKNPISLARAVMERTPHVMLIGKGAEEFARTLPSEVVETRTCEYFWTESRHVQLENVRLQEDMQNQSLANTMPSIQMKVQLDHHQVPKPDENKFGTVGCVVAIPIHHHHATTPQVLLASATSTGGMTNQRYNRVGDSPIIGAGTYANHLCAISCTGHGEHFIRCVAAHDIAKRLEYKYGYGSFQNNEKEEGNTEADGSALQLAVEEVVLGTLVGNCEEETGQGGVIAIDRDGNFIAKMNCPGMYHGWVYEDGEMETRIFREECMNDCTSS